MRFNPPPNWPPAPPGWAPDSNWSPDPSWPPPPPGWQFWIDDSTAQFPPGYPLQYPPWPPPPGPGSRKLLWIALAAAAVVGVLVVGLGVSVAGRMAHIREAKPSTKPDITELTPNLLVNRSAFPEISGGKWISGVNGAGGARSDMPNMTIDPPECADLYGDSKAATQTATATLANLQPSGLHSMRVHLAITQQHRNMKDYLQKCRSFTQTFETSGHSVTTDVRLDPLDADGVPPWAVATVMSSSSAAARRIPVSVTAATVSGYYRGVLVVASSNRINLRPKGDAAIGAEATDDLVRLFNTQVEKLEEAP